MEQQVFIEQPGAAPVSMVDQHLACVLLLDCSGSMSTGNDIGKLNDALVRFKEQCINDEALMRGLDIAVVCFNETVRIAQDFTPVQQMITPVLEASGKTAMGAALNVAIDLLENRKSQYKEIGIPYHRPWIFMISDGMPTDDIQPAFQRINEMQQLKKLELWAVGAPGYDEVLLTSLTNRVIALDENLQFAPLFEWLSNSLSQRNQSNPGDRIQYKALPSGSRVVPNTWGV